MIKKNFKSSIITIIKDLNILYPHIIKMKKQKSIKMYISKVLSSDDDEYQAKPKIDKEEFKKYIKDSDDESSQEQITPKSSPQKPKVKRKKSPRLQDLPPIQPNKTISQKITQKYLA